jgi:hypothetical protein
VKVNEGGERDMRRWRGRERKMRKAGVADVKKEQGRIVRAAGTTREEERKSVLCDLV